MIPFSISSQSTLNDILKPENIN